MDFSENRIALGANRRHTNTVPSPECTLQPKIGEFDLIIIALPFLNYRPVAVYLLSPPGSTLKLPTPLSLQPSVLVNIPFPSQPYLQQEVSESPDVVQ